MKRDTFTYSSPTVKQTAPKTTAKTTSASKNTATKASTAKTNATSSQTTASKAMSTAKTAVSAKSTQTNKSASAVKTNTTAKTSNTKTALTAKSISSFTGTKRDTFTYSSEAVKNAVKSATASKSAANSKSTVQNNAKSSQTKTAVKSNSSNKSAASGTVSKSNTNSSKKAMLESMQKAYEHTKDPKQREAMRKTMNDIAYELSSKKTNKTTDILVKYDRSKIKSQFEYYDGDKACYATSADNMWRVNDGAVGNKIIKLADEHKNDGIITGASCDDNYMYISDSGKVFKTNGQNVVKEYCGKDDNGKEYTAVRIQGLSKDDYNDLVLQELNKNKIVCARVVKNVGDDPKNGHTMNIVGTNSQREFLYENCGRSSSMLSTLKPVPLAETAYSNTKYYEVQDGQFEIWIDTTK